MSTRTARLWRCSFLTTLLALASAGCGFGSTDPYGAGTKQQLMTAAQGQEPGSLPSAAQQPQYMTATQSRVLGFESPAGDWSSNNGSPIGASTDKTQGTGSLSVAPGWYTEVSSVSIEAPGAAAATASFDLRIPQALPWGEVRLIVKAPSQGHYWSDLGGRTLVGLTPGEFHGVVFPIPQGVRDALNSDALDVTFTIVINAPAASGTFLIDNLDVGGGGPPPASDGTGLFTLSAPCDSTLANLLVSGTDRLVVDDRSTLGAPGTVPVVAVGAGGFELGASVQAHVDVTSRGETDLLRSRAHVFGSIRTAGFLTEQDGVLIDGALHEESPSTMTTTSWSVTWPDSSAGDLTFPSDSPNVAVDPGAYGALHAYSRATFTLTAGSYFFDSFVLEPEVHFRVNSSAGPVRIYVKNALLLQVGIEYSGGNAGQVLFGYLGHAAASFNEALVASVVAPNGSIELRRPQSDLPYRGSFFGKSVHVFSDAKVEHLALDWTAVCEADGALGCEKSESCGGPQVVECTPGETASIVDVRGEASVLWHGKEIAETGRALSTMPEFEIEFDRDVRGDHPLAWFRPIGCEGDVFARALEPTILSTTLTLRPESVLTRGCTYRLIIAWYRALGPDGACLDEMFELEFRVAARDEPHDLALAQRVDGDGPLLYFRLREGVSISPEEAFVHYEDEIGIAELDLRRGQKFDLSWRDKTRWSFVQHVNGYPVRGAGYMVEVVQSGDDENLYSASGRLAADVDVANSPSISEGTALSTALGAIGLSPADWATLPDGELVVWVSPPATLGAPVQYALAWKFSLDAADLSDSSSRLETHTAWINATANEVLELESTSMRDVPVGAEPNAYAQYQTQGPLKFTATRWNLTAGGTEVRVNALYGTDAAPNYVQLRDEFEIEQSTADPNGDAYWETTEGGAAGAALLMHTAQAARPFIDGLNLFDWWRGFDGVDSSPLRIVFYPPGVHSTFAPAPRANPTSGFVPGDEVVVHFGYGAPYNVFDVLPNVLVHEFSHFVNNHSRIVQGRAMFSQGGDGGAIHEGVADAFGITYANNVLGDPAWSTNPVFTYAPTTSPHERNVEDPWITQNPRTVGDQYFGSDGHTNSTIVSRWAYLLGTGDNTIAGACNVPVSQLVPGNVSESLVRVLRIASDAFFEVSDNPSLAEFREKTEDAASRLYDETAAAHVAEAWMAVAVGGAGHAELTQFAPAPLSNLHPWKVEFSWQGLGRTWEMQVAKTKAGLDTAAVQLAPSLPDGTAMREVDLEPGQKYYWRARVAGASSWSGCALLESSFTTAEVPIELRADSNYALPWSGDEDDIYEPGYRGIVSWMPVPGAEYDLFFAEGSGDACSGSPVATTNDTFAVLEPWDDYWSSSEDKEPEDGVAFESFTSEMDGLSAGVHTIGIRPRPLGSDVAGECYEFSMHKRIIEHFTQDWPQLDDLPSVSFDPARISRKDEPRLLPPPEFRFTPAENVRPDVPAVEGYRLTIERRWIEDDIVQSEAVYDEYQDVDSHPALADGKWKFEEGANYEWLGTPLNRPDAYYHQPWQLYAVVDGQERPAALAPGPYEDVVSAPNQVLWGASDLPPGHFMSPEPVYSEHLIKSAASWDEIAATREVIDFHGEDRVAYTVDWTLEIDSFWEDNAIPVYPSSPAGPMTGYMLDLYVQTPEVGHIEVDTSNYLDVGFGGKFDPDGEGPKFAMGDEGTTEIAAVVVATPFNRDDNGIYWAGHPTHLQFRVHWVDDEPDSTECGGRGQQCCFLDGDSCDWGECQDDGKCNGCGLEGEACCEDDPVCEYGTLCKEDTCERVPQCNSEVHHGANDEEAITVDLKYAEGKSRFFMDTEEVPDRMVVRDASGNPILTTPCVGTQQLDFMDYYCATYGYDPDEGKCVVPFNDGTHANCYNEWPRAGMCEFAEGWWCQADGGGCSKEFFYEGGSLLTVEAIPNCEGTEDTIWSFRVECPVQ